MARTKASHIAAKADSTLPYTKYHLFTFENNPLSSYFCPFSPNHKPPSTAFDTSEAALWLALGTVYLYGQTDILRPGFRSFTVSASSPRSPSLHQPQPLCRDSAVVSTLRNGYGDSRLPLIPLLPSFIFLPHSLVTLFSPRGPSPPLSPRLSSHPALNSSSTSHRLLGQPHLPPCFPPQNSGYAALASPTAAPHPGLHTAACSSPVHRHSGYRPRWSFHRDLIPDTCIPLHTPC